MILVKYIKNFLFAAAVLYLLTGCSASTRSQRYNQSKDKNGTAAKTSDQEKNKDSQRFDKTGNDDILIVEDLPDTSSEEFDEVPVEENPIDKSKFVANINKLKSFNVALTPREKILLEVIKYLDTPYKYGGNTGNGIDCSAFTKQVFENSIAVELPRSAREQFEVGEKIDEDELKFGDLVFFNTRKTNNPGHVGIYLGENQFAHASRTLGVTVSSLHSKYYKTRFAGARRMTENINR